MWAVSLSFDVGPPSVSVGTVSSSVVSCLCLPLGRFCESQGRYVRQFVEEESQDVDAGVGVRRRGSSAAAASIAAW